VLRVLLVSVTKPVSARRCWFADIYVSCIVYEPNYVLHPVPEKRSIFKHLQLFENLETSCLTPLGLICSHIVQGIKVSRLRVSAVSLVLLPTSSRRESHHNIVEEVVSKAVQFL
jgi:hypothetical protein